jgi:hypothetical protein
MFIVRSSISASCVFFMSCALAACGTSSGSTSDAGPGGNMGGVTDGAAAAGSCPWGGTWSVTSTQFTGSCAPIPAFPTALAFTSDGTLVDGGTVGSSCTESMSPETSPCKILGVVCEGWALTLLFAQDSNGTVSTSGVASVFVADGGTCSVTFSLAR